MYDNARNVKRSHNCWFGGQESDMTNVTAAILSLRFYVFTLHTDNKRRCGRAPTPINWSGENIEYL